MHNEHGDRYIAKLKAGGWESEEEGEVVVSDLEDSEVTEEPAGADGVPQVVVGAGGASGGAGAGVALGGIDNAGAVQSAEELVAEGVEGATPGMPVDVAEALPEIVGAVEQEENAYLLGVAEELGPPVALPVGEPVAVVEPVAPGPQVVGEQDRERIIDERATKFRRSRKVRKGERLPWSAREQMRAEFGEDVPYQGM